MILNQELKPEKPPEIPLRHGCSPVNLLHIFRTLFTKNFWTAIPE